MAGNARAGHGLTISLRQLATLIAAIAVACGSPDRERSAERDVAVQVPLRNLSDKGPELRRGAIAISPFGHIAFTGGFHQGGELITIVDSSGRLIARVGREGHGPGELQGAYYLFFQDSTLTAADVFQGRLVQYSVDGAYLRTINLGSLMIPTGHVDDSVDLADHNRATGPRVIRRSLDNADGFRTLISQGDTLFQRLIDRSRRNPTALRELIGSTVDGALLGDGLTYALFEYTPHGVEQFGRLLEPLISDGHPPDTLSYFGLYSSDIDQYGRIWVAGADLVGGYLDVYEGTSLVHRQRVACVPNPWYGMSVAGRWMAILCKADDADTVEVKLQMYRLRP